MSTQIATANKLDDGYVVYLTRDGHWSRDIDDARVGEHADDIAEMEAEAKAAERGCLVVGAYLTDVEVVHGEAVPIRYRERIRAFGPSTHPAFAKKQVAAHFEPQADVSAVFLNGL